jgi:hypothetical protein
MRAVSKRGAALAIVINVIDTANKNVDASNAQTVELALKSADAEIQAKTWDGKVTGDTTVYTHDTLTVAIALKHEGIALTTITNATKSGAAWTYKSGKVYCDSDHKTTGTDPSTALTDGLFVKNVIAP